MNGNRKDLTGQRFGRLVVIEPVTTGEYRNSVWLCQCDCGNKKIVPTYKLLNGRTFSCGCYRKQSKQVIEELAKVKTENERLKAENERLKAPSMIIPQVGKLGVPIEQYCKLKQALEEVREIANKRNVGCGKFCEVNRKEHICNAECNAFYLKQIQNKIDEVLEDV